jgi:hypothetical protein
MSESEFSATFFFSNEYAKAHFFAYSFEKSDNLRHEIVILSAVWYAFLHVFGQNGKISIVILSVSARVRPTWLC